MLAAHFDRVVPAGEALTVERFLELMKGAGFPPDDEWYCIPTLFAASCVAASHLVSVVLTVAQKWFYLYYMCVHLLCNNIVVHPRGHLPIGVCY